VVVFAALVGKSGNESRLNIGVNMKEFSFQTSGSGYVTVLPKKSYSTVRELFLAVERALDSLKKYARVNSANNSVAVAARIIHDFDGDIPASEWWDIAKKRQWQIKNLRDKRIWGFWHKEYGFFQIWSPGSTVSDQDCPVLRKDGFYLHGHKGE
jgi:hypothetical protein